MKFQLTINLGNDLMRSSDDLARAIQNVIYQLYGVGSDHPLRKGTFALIFDENGNKVGRWCLR